jgi:hypothetical protein
MISVAGRNVGKELAMLNKRAAFIAVLLFGMPMAHAGQAVGKVYDAFKQYSIKINPNGPWSYLTAGQLLTLKHKNCNSLKKDYCWTNNNDGYPTETADEANKSGKTIQYLDVVLPANYLDFDPEQGANVAFQWTAPTSGKIQVSGNFLGVATDEGSHQVAVLHNGTALGTYTIEQYQQKQNFEFSVTVAAGDTISFISYTGNNGDALSTGLQAKITVQ